MEYLVEKVCALCYERPWYAKLGGCEAIRFLYTKMAINWVYKHLYTFVKAQLFVMMDLSGEVKIDLFNSRANFRSLTNF